MHSLRPTQFEVVFRILRCLKRTLGKGLLFKNRGHLQVKAYTDADWAGDVTNRRSTWLLHFGRREFSHLEEQKAECCG